MTKFITLHRFERAERFSLNSISWFADDDSGRGGVLRRGDGGLCHVRESADEIDDLIVKAGGDVLRMV